MKRAIFFILILLVAVWIGTHIVKDPGYVLFAYQKTTIEMPLWFFVLAVLILFSVLYYLILFLKGVVHFRQSLHYRLKKRRSVRAQHQTHLGIIALSEGKFKKAEAYLSEPLTTRHHPPLVNYFGAARAAYHQGELARSKQYLDKASDTWPEANLAADLTTVALHIGSGAFEQARDVLLPLYEAHPKHPHVLHGLKKVYWHLEDWTALLALLPALKHRQVLTGEAFENLQHHVVCALLSEHAQDPNLGDLARVWAQVPRWLRTDVDVLAPYTKGLIACGEHAQAEKLLRQAQKQQTYTPLLTLYASLTEIDQSLLLKHIEHWLHQTPEHAGLLHAAGVVSYRLQLWGKAKDYLIRSVSRMPEQHTYYMLGQTYLALNDTPEALAYFKKAASDHH